MLVVGGPLDHPFTAVLSSWSIGALFFSLGPELADELFSTTNAVISGVGIVALAGSAAASQFLTVRLAPWIGAAAGSLALAVGILVIVAAAHEGSGALFVAGSIVGGAGFGAAFLGGLRALVGAIPAGHRASVMSAFYIVAYASLSIPAVLAGLVATHLGLEGTFELFGSIVAVLALVVAFEAARTRPRAVGSRVPVAGQE